uniref:Uncharacterized protein n=1 Tax=Lactuca sativa TaxID=4236 RepID=A0A9R1XMM3_LACSA|nr:hypothetical protein LSAT_V11C300134190 [Lactuca sativa]
MMSGLPHATAAWYELPIPAGDVDYPRPGCVTSPFVKELLDYHIPNTAKLPTLKTYNGTTDPDSHIDTYEWTMTSLKLNEKFWCTYFSTTLEGNTLVVGEKLRNGISECIGTVAATSNQLLIHP